MIRAMATRFSRFFLLGGSIAVALATPREAEASGYLTARFGSDYGTPAQPNTYAIYFNPAALGGTTGATITGDVSVLLRWARYQRTAAALDEDQLGDQQYIDANSGHGNLTDLLALPYLGANSDFGTKWFRGGFAVYVPFGGMAKWEKRDGIPGVPGTKDGAQRWHNISGQLLAIYPTFAGAFKVHEKVSLGVSVTPVIHHVATVRARNSDGSDDIFEGTTLKEGRSLLEASGVNVAASVGVYVEPAPEWKIGVSYLVPPGIIGDTRMSGTLQTKLGTNAATNQDVDFLQSYPHIVRLGAAWQAGEKIMLRGDMEYVTWSTFERQCIVKPGEDCNVAEDGRDLSNGRVILDVPRRWMDSVGARLGPVYSLTDRLDLFGSLAFTTPAVPKETIDASTIDAFRIYGVAGAHYKVNEHLGLAGSYNHIYFMPVDTEGANDQNISAHPERGPYDVSRSPSADGRYRSAIGFLNVNVAYSF
jgi:long-chain fatty acid transport protein